jgi:hypothetical protein
MGTITSVEKIARHSTCIAECPRLSYNLR